MVSVQLFSKNGSFAGPKWNTETLALGCEAIDTSLVLVRKQSLVENPRQGRRHVWPKSPGEPWPGRRYVSTVAAADCVRAGSACMHACVVGSLPMSAFWLALAMRQSLDERPEIADDELVNRAPLYSFCAHGLVDNHLR
jgi:hypothetical protein